MCTIDGLDLHTLFTDENFHKLQTSFLEKYWQEFEDGDENKHSYMPIFKEYVRTLACLAF